MGDEILLKHGCSSLAGMQSSFIYSTDIPAFIQYIYSAYINILVYIQYIHTYIAHIYTDIEIACNHTYIYFVHTYLYTSKHTYICTREKYVHIVVLYVCVCLYVYTIYVRPSLLIPLWDLREGSKSLAAMRHTTTCVYSCSPRYLLVPLCVISHFVGVYTRDNTRSPGSLAYSV